MLSHYLPFKGRRDCCHLMPPCFSRDNAVGSRPSQQRTITWSRTFPPHESFHAKDGPQSVSLCSRKLVKAPVTGRKPNLLSSPLLGRPEPNRKSKNNPTPKATTLSLSLTAATTSPCFLITIIIMSKPSNNPMATSPSASAETPPASLPTDNGDPFSRRASDQANRNKPQKDGCSLSKALGEEEEEEEEEEIAKPCQLSAVSTSPKLNADASSSPSLKATPVMTKTTKIGTMPPRRDQEEEDYLADGCAVM